MWCEPLSLFPVHLVYPEMTNLPRSQDLPNQLKPLGLKTSRCGWVVMCPFVFRIQDCVHMTCPSVAGRLGALAGGLD